MNKKSHFKNAFLRFSVDSLALAFAFVAAFFVRLDFSFYLSWCARMLLHIPFLVGCELLAFWFVGVYQGAWRFVSITDVRKISLAILLAQIPICLMRIVCGALMDDFPLLRYGVLPWGVICINMCFAVLAASGIRMIRRMQYEHSIRQNAVGVVIEPTIVIGSLAGSKQILESIRLHPELGIELVGIIDDGVCDSKKIQDVPILGTLDNLNECIASSNAKQAIIAQNDATPEMLSRILDACAGGSLKTRIVPGMNDLIAGKVDVVQMREIAVEDLLRRDPVQLDRDKISKFLSGRRILVSGAGGSIGSEICRQILAFEPQELVLLERCELFLYEIDREFKKLAPNIHIIPRLADICDASRMDEIFDECRPEVVFHAAAYKHVPMIEYNPGEAIRNNVEGTACIAECAVKHGCDAFVMISTDKAVNPTSIMGTSKRIAELYIQALSGLNKTRFCAVRFGNVLGSTGSVLPLFKSQIASGGPVTVTHPEMKRYFMTIPEASQLVMQAATMGKNGEIFVLDMGKPVKIVDLARDMIRLSGKTVNDVPIVFSGTRPGEKLFEELGFDAEKMDHTQHPKIYVGKLQNVEIEWIREKVEKLKAFRDSQDNRAVREAMRDIVPEMVEPEKEGEGADCKL